MHSSTNLNFNKMKIKWSSNFHHTLKNRKLNKREIATKKVPMSLSRCLKVQFRQISSVVAKAPPFHEVFPSKTMVNRLLFELDSRLTFSKLYPVYEQMYNNLSSGVPTYIPKDFKSKDIMVMKKVLEKFRHRTKAINKNVLALENELLDVAAEMGDNDAIALLCFDTLKSPELNSHDDVEHARKLVKHLYQMGHPLTVKLTADLAMKSKDDKTAEEYYLKFLNLQDDTFLAGEVYGQLGEIYFRRPDLQRAEECFLKSIKLCPIDYSVRSYFLLGQMYINTDVLKAKSLIESSATQGFRESFKTLGMLEMNYFKNIPKAQEWFKLGMELFDMGCYIGYFDSAMMCGEYSKARKCFDSMVKIAETNEGIKELLTEFAKHREADLNKINEYTTLPSFLDSLDKLDRGTPTTTTQDNKWDI